MERKIGEIFEFGGEWYQAIDNTNSIMCSGCAFVNGYNECEVDISVVGNCGCKDGNPLIFKKLEKVGEPYQYIDGIYQEYKATLPFFIRDATYIETVNGFAIKIKQNKEDMEEKKIQHYDCFFDREPSKSNLKPFDLEAAKAGKPVCTRDGRKARIICFDAKDTQPIIGLYEKNIDGIVREYLCSYHTDGRMYDDQDTGYDLMMLPEKKEGWVNIVRGSNGKSHMGRGIFQSKEEAEDAIKAFSDNLIDTIKVSWEE